MRRQLVAVTLAVTTMVITAFALPLGATVARLADNLAAQEAEDVAEQLARAVGSLLRAPDVETLERFVGPDGPTLRAVHLPDEVIGSYIDHEDLAASLELAWAGEGVSAADGGSHLALIPVFTSTSTPAAIAVASVPRGTSTRSVWAAWAVLGALSLAMIGLAALLADRLGRRLVRPVEALAHGARLLATGDLEATVPVEGPPEIRDVAHGFNRLGRRIRDLLQDEREVIADLSHRLRTPLTALRLELEGRAASAIVDELAATVDDIISEAREPHHRHLSSQVDLAALVRSRVEFWGALAEEEKRAVSLRLESSPTEVEINQRAYAAAFDALLENVFAHTPPGTPYAVALEALGDTVVLTVEDGGPGLPDGVDVLSRGSSSVGSTGLGLDICLRLARSNGGTFDIIASSLGGAGFRLAVPRG